MRHYKRPNKFSRIFRILVSKTGLIFILALLPIITVCGYVLEIVQRKQKISLVKIWQEDWAQWIFLWED